jgi:hypothetical protein
MIDLTAARWETFGTVAGVLALAIWALRTGEAGAGRAAADAEPCFRFRHAGRVQQVVCKDGVVLGRAPDCDVVIPDRSVSKYHARIGYAEEVTIADLGSTNGTYLNGRRVDAETPLRSGDRIALGAAKIVFLGPVGRLKGVSKG